MNRNNAQKAFMKKICCICIALSFGLGSCSSSTSKSDASDVLSLKKTEDGRTQITVLVKYSFEIHNFETVVEEKFPDIDIVQVGNYTSNTALAKEYETRLKNDDLTDIVLTWPYDVGQQYWEERLIDLSGMPFSRSYNASMLDSIASDDGSLYYLPGPAQIRGIIYNKTMFTEYGWAVPTNYEEFIALCKQIEATGNRAFQLPLGNAEVLNTAFVGFNYGTAYSKPADNDWLAEYNEGNGSFIDHFDEALLTFENLIQEGVLKKEDLNLFYADSQSNLFNRKTVMTEDSVLLARLAKQMGNSDEFALMPFFNRNPNNDWSRIYMTCFIGLNKHLQDEDNQEKYDKVLKIMDYISTEEGQTALSSDNGAMYSSLRNIEAPDVAEISDLERSLSQGRYGIFPTLKRSEDALRYGLRNLILGNTTTQQLAEIVDQENRLEKTTKKDAVIGNALENFTFIDTGSFVCDVMKEAADTDIALFLDNGKDGLYNGKGISAKFYKGSILDADISRIFPDLKHEEQGVLDVVEMSGANLLKALEYTLPVDNKEGWFYYFSGLKLTFHPTEEPGKRISKLTTSDGKAIEDDKIYRVAIMDQTVSNEYIENTENTEIVIKNLLREVIKEKKEIIPAHDGRFTIANK